MNVEEEQGWVPSSCLEREDGIKEDSTVRLSPGEGELKRNQFFFINFN